MDFNKIVLDFVSMVSNINFGSILAFIGVSFLIFWIVVLGWVWSDSSERVSSKLFRILSVSIVAILNVPGLIIYMLIRPKATIEEIYWADLERRYLKHETSELGDCPSCGQQLEPGFVVCPNCGEAIKEKCESCGEYVKKSWQFCPACGIERKSQKQAEADAIPEITSEVMEEAIETTREEIKEVVASKKTRYARDRGFFAKVSSVKNRFTNYIRGLGQKIKDKRVSIKVKPELMLSQDNSINVPGIIAISKKSNEERRKDKEAQRKKKRKKKNNKK